MRADGQKVLLAVKSMGGESAEAWRSVLDDLIGRGLPRPEPPGVLSARGAGAIAPRPALSASGQTRPASRSNSRTSSALRSRAFEPRLWLHK
jgi:hypothetical protein